MGDQKSKGEQKLSFAFLVEIMKSSHSLLKSRAKVRDQVTRRKRLIIVFGEAKPPKQEVWRAECTEAKTDDYASVAVAVGFGINKAQIIPSLRPYRVFVMDFTIANTRFSFSAGTTSRNGICFTNTLFVMVWVIFPRYLTLCIAYDIIKIEYLIDFSEVI